MTAPRKPLALPIVVLAALAADPARAVDLFVKPDGSGASCTQSSPCALETAVASGAAGDSIFLAGGTYTGSGSEIVHLIASVSLLGGWDAAPSGPVLRDPVANESVLDGENARRAVRVTGGAPTLDGLTLRHGNASGQTVGCGNLFRTTNACGGAVLVVGAAATITGSLFVDNAADTTSADPGSAALGGAIHAMQATGLVVRGNVFRGNLASAAAWGIGGALQVAVPLGDVTISENRFVGNHGTEKPGSSGVGGAVSISEARDHSVAVLRNVFIDNVARATPYDQTTSSDGNAVYANHSTVDLAANLVRSDALGFAVYLERCGGSVSGNTVLAGSDHSSLLLWEGAAAPLAVTNNVLAGGSYATLRATGSPSSPLQAVLTANTITNSLGGVGILAEGNATVTMTDNIVAGHATGIVVSDNASVLPDHTLFWNNGADGIRGTDPVDGDPFFVNAPAGDFHVQAGGAAVGTGVQAYVPCSFPVCPLIEDIDGDPRPGDGAVDIGADEVAPRIFDFGTPSSPVEGEDVQVTHLTAYAAARGYGWLSGSIASRDRGSSDNLLRDFCFTQLGTFAVDLPNGPYWVTVIAGDATTAHSQMGIYLEGTLAATLNTAANQFMTPRLPVSVTDGQLTVLLDDLGGSDVNVVINGLTIEPRRTVRVDLGTPSSPLDSQYEGVSHGSVYSPAARIGWRGGVIASRDRGGADKLLRDLDFTRRGSFGLFLQNGVYDVTLTLGDSAGTHDQMGVSVQGAAPDSITANKNQFVTRRFRTFVADNLLDVLLDDLGGSDVNVVVNAIEVAPPPPSRFDFGTPTSEVQPGWVRVTERTRYDDGMGYGWRLGTVASRDRGPGNRLRQDLNFTREGVFSVDILDGRYDVTVTMGDAAAAHDQMWVTLEGTHVATVTTAKGEFHTETFTVSVTDGTLDVAIEDGGGADVNAVINALEIR